MPTAPASTCWRATARAAEKSPSTISFLKRAEPVTLVRSPILMNVGLISGEASFEPSPLPFAGERAGGGGGSAAATVSERFGDAERTLTLPSPHFVGRGFLSQLEPLQAGKAHGLWAVRDGRRRQAGDGFGHGADGVWRGPAAPSQDVDQAAFGPLMQVAAGLVRG